MAVRQAGAMLAASDIVKRSHGRHLTTPVELSLCSDELLPESGILANQRAQNVAGKPC
jgi:hypothetical protein